MGLAATAARPAEGKTHLGVAVRVGGLLFDEPHMGGLGALLAFGDLKLDGLPLLQRAVAGGLNRAEVDEDIRAAIDGDEAIALMSM